MTSQAEADDLVMGVVTTAWTAPAAASAAFPMLYDNVGANLPGDTWEPGGNDDSQDEPYARATIRTSLEGQSTQGRQRKFETQSFITVQVFTPVGDGHVLGRTLCKVLTDALKNATASVNGVWFFDVVALEVGVEGALYQYNVNAIFRYQS